MIPTNFTDKADEWRSWQEEVAGYVDTVTQELKKVLAEIDQETDVTDDFWRHARETKYGKVMEEHTNLWRLLRRITEGESKKVVMSIKGEDGFRAWQKLKQRFEPALAARQGLVMAEFSGTVARPAKSPGETIALLTEVDRKMKLVEDVTGEEVSEMHARSVVVGILDPVARQRTAMNHSKSYEALKKIVQEFANNSTTSQEAMQSGRVEAGATAPDGSLAAFSGRDVRGQLGRIWHVCTTVLDLQRIRSRIPGLSQWQGHGLRQGQLRQGQGRIRMGQEQQRREQGQQLRDVQGRLKG